MPASHHNQVEGGNRSTKPALIVDRVSKRYARDLRRAQRSGVSAIVGELIGGSRNSRELRESEFWALQDVSLQVRPGEAVGLIGRNGAGKSTLLRMIAGITQPTSGTINHLGRLGCLLEPSAGFNTVLSGRENATVAYALLRGEPPTDEMIDQIVTFAGIADAIDHPVRTYSQGMRMRLGFSTMVHVDPDVLLIDEALAVGDTAFQRQCIDYLHSFCRAGGALVFVSHSLWMFQNLASRGICLDEGRIVMDGSTGEVADHYVTALQRGTWDDAGEGPDLLEREHIVRRAVPSRSGEAVPAAEQAVESASQRRPVQFSSVRCTQPDGRAPQTGAPMDVCFELESREVVASAELAFTIWTADLSICVTADVMPGVGSPSISTFALDVGPQVIRCLIGELPILAGEYAVRAAVYEATTSDVMGMIGFEDTPAWFRVLPADDELDPTVRVAAHRLRPIRQLQVAVLTPVSGPGPLDSAAPSS